LRCADVHIDVSCDASWRSSNSDELLFLAERHGASVHGFTPAWYTKRLALMRAAVTD
jgi:hypothetical protein